uniref:Uncharacterized protein n=1 Tax=Anguilla anguilla TaxID=7936 RepID=A0A0E9V9P6_ANGAN
MQATETLIYLLLRCVKRGPSKKDYLLSFFFLRGFDK